MTPNEMLSYVHEAGEDSSSDYHDGLDGWFGWTVSGDVLTVTWKPDGEGTDGGDAATASWRLVLVAAPGTGEQP